MTLTHPLRQSDIVDYRAAYFAAKKSRSADWRLIHRVSGNGFGLQPSTPYTI